MANCRLKYLLVIIVAVLAAPISATGQGSGLGPRIIVGPYLMHTTPTSMTVMWETNRPADSMVEYGRSTPLTESVKIDEKASIHEVVITGLEPGTGYFYRVVSGSGGRSAKSKILTFKTAVNTDSAYAFVVIGDNRTLIWNFRKIAELAWAERPDFVLHVGDVVTDGRVKSQWKREFFDPASVLMSHVPTYIAIGNHEEDADWYYKYVSYPGRENYYSFDYGNAHFTIVDTNKQCRPGSEQYEWVESDLSSSQAVWKFVAHHHPPFSSDENDYGETSKEISTMGDTKVRQLVPLYEKYGVDIVWVGHIHSYERTWPIRDGRVDQERGVIYIQTGGGGAPLEDFAPTRSWFTAKVKRDWQYCLVLVHGGHLRVMAYDIEGRLYDYLEINK